MSLTLRVLAPDKSVFDGTVEEVILPSTTRKRICRSLEMLKNKRLKNPWKKHDNIPL